MQNEMDHFKRLESSGFTRMQAEASVQVLGAAMSEFATKKDMENEFKILRSQIAAQFSEQQSFFIKMFCGAVASVLTLITLLGPFVIKWWQYVLHQM